MFVIEKKSKILSRDQTKRGQEQFFSTTNEHA